jgi:hypothetical protein
MIAATLAQKIADAVQPGNPNLVTAEFILDAVPELAGFDILAKQVEESYQAAQDDLVKDPENQELVQIRDGYAKAYLEATGENPAEVEADAETQAWDDVEDPMSGPDEYEE